MRLDNEEKAGIVCVLVLLWMIATTLAGYPALWIIPFCSFSGLLCVGLITSTIRDIYHHKRRDNNYDRELLERIYRAQYQEDKRKP